MASTIKRATIATPPREIEVLRRDTGDEQGFLPARYLAT